MTQVYSLQQHDQSASGKAEYTGTYATTDISTASRLSTVVMEVPNMTCSNKLIVNVRPMMWMRKSRRATIRVTTSQTLMVCKKLRPFIIQ